MIEKLAERKRVWEEKAAKTEANKRRRVEAAEQRIIDAHEKKKATEARIAEEACVADFLKAHGCWSSNTDFIKASDMIDFLRANRKHLEKRDNFSLSLKKPAAFEFISCRREP